MFTGIITALVTPFRNDFVDETALRALVDDQIKNGVDGLVPWDHRRIPTLNFEEHIRVIKIVVEAARKRVPVIAGTGSNSTLEAIELSKKRARSAADGLLQVTPYYNRPTQDGLYRHFKAIVDAVPLPTIVYNVPAAPRAICCPRRWRAWPSYRRSSASRKQPARPARVADPGAHRERLIVLSGDERDGIPLFALGARDASRWSVTIAPAEIPRCGTRCSTATGRRPATCTTLAAAQRGAVRRAEPDARQGGAGDDGPHGRRDAPAPYPMSPGPAREAARAPGWR